MSCLNWKRYTVLADQHPYQAQLLSNGAVSESQIFDSDARMVKFAVEKGIAFYPMRVRLFFSMATMFESYSCEYLVDKFWRL